eukprot:13247472-Heterocapsa_arctica.AAC.1
MLSRGLQQIRLGRETNLARTRSGAVAVQRPLWACAADDRPTSHCSGQASTASLRLLRLIDTLTVAIP